MINFENFKAIKRYINKSSIEAIFTEPATIDGDFISTKHNIEDLYIITILFKSGNTAKFIGDLKDTKIFND